MLQHICSYIRYVYRHRPSDEQNADNAPTAISDEELDAIINGTQFISMDPDPNSATNALN